jgi:hypothetical protein
VYVCAARWQLTCLFSYNTAYGKIFNVPERVDLYDIQMSFPFIFGWDKVHRLILYSCARPCGELLWSITRRERSLRAIRNSSVFDLKARVVGRRPDTREDTYMVVFSIRSCLTRIFVVSDNGRIKFPAKSVGGVNTSETFK